MNNDTLHDLTEPEKMFAYAIIKLAQKHAIPPGDAVQVFGRIAGVLAEFEQLRLGLPVAEGHHHLMVLFADGLHADTQVLKASLYTPTRHH